MKKIKFLLSFVFILTIVAFTSNAQTRLGVRGGLNISNLYTNDVDDNNLLVGFHAGAYFKLAVNDNFAIEPEFLYSTKGAKLEYNNTFVNGTATFHLNYIDIPVLAVFNITENFQFHAGPYIGILTAANVTNDSDNNNFDFENELDKNDFTSTDLGVIGGLGIDVDKVNISLRYNYGLNNIGRERQFLGTTYTFPDAKNSVLQLSIGLSIL